MKRKNVLVMVFSLWLSCTAGTPVYAQAGMPLTNFSPKNPVKTAEQASEQPGQQQDQASVGDATVKKEAEKAIEEKKTIEAEAQEKEQAAAIAQQELEVLKKEAETTRDPELKKQVRELIAQTEKLNKEAALAQEKLKVAETKAQTAQRTLAAYEARRPVHEKLVMALFIIGAGIFLFVLLKVLLRRFEKALTKKDIIREDEATLRLKTLLSLLHWLGNILIVIVVVYMVLATFGFNVAPLLAGAGIVGLAFGFGGQYLIRDLINGLFILLEGQYRVNDVVKINEYGGLVEDINLRITTLRDLEGRVIVVPNGEIKTVVNYTRGYAQALFDIGVAYKENVDRVMQVIKEVGKGMREDPYFRRFILADLEMFGVDDFGDSQVTIKFRIKTLPMKQWEVAREFRRRLKNRFDELGIEIPFPHRTLYWGAGSDNDWLRDFAQVNTQNTAQSKTEK